MILAILNLYVAPMPPNKFQLNPIYGLGGDVVCRFSTRRPSWISEQNVFINYISPCGPNASHQVWAQSDRVQEQMWFQDFQDGCSDSHPG